VIATFSPTKLSNIHSFSVTENYAIFFFYPVIIDPKARGWREQMFSPTEKSAKFQNQWVKGMCPQSSARICKRLRNPGIDSQESIPRDWEPIPWLLKGYKYGLYHALF
jgi:carotenoid cleavage dioxygenase-like enzyme